MSQSPNSTAIALGGEEIVVTLRGGLTERVKVRILEIDQLYRFIDLCMSDRLLAEFICEQPAGWAATLTVPSLLDVVEKAKELNFQTARRWAEHRAALLEALVPIGMAVDHPKPSSSAASVPASE